MTLKWIKCNGEIVRRKQIPQEANPHKLILDALNGDWRDFGKQGDILVIE